MKGPDFHTKELKLDTGDLSFNSTSTNSYTKCVPIIDLISKDLKLSNDDNDDEDDSIAGINTERAVSAALKGN